MNEKKKIDYRVIASLTSNFIEKCIKNVYMHVYVFYICYICIPESRFIYSM